MKARAHAPINVHTRPSSTDAFWTGIDNGEGMNGPPDDATDLRFGAKPGTAALHCAVGIDLATLEPSMRGEVQVQP